MAQVLLSDQGADGAVLIAGWRLVAAASSASPSGRDSACAVEASARGPRW